MNTLAVPWVQLPGQQNILVQALFSESEYSVRITDLQTVWGEDLSCQLIKTRARDVDCPLDADTNLKDLLKHLQDALTVDSSKVAILLKRSLEQLRLVTRETIGKAVIEWPFELSALPYSAVATGLTLSLFSMMTFYQNEVNSLLDVIEDKDTVIRQMNEFLKTANLTFKPNRRQKAFNKFNKVQWQEQCRDKALKDQKSSQEVIDDLSLIGRDSVFRKEWRAVLSNISAWDVKFLPEHAERTPAKVLSSTKKRRQNTAAAKTPLVPKVSLVKEDTQAEAGQFLSPEATRVKDKLKIHTKWSSPVSTTLPSSDSALESETAFGRSGHILATPDKSNARGRSRSLSIQGSPTPRPNNPKRGSQASKLELLISPVQQARYQTELTASDDELDHQDLSSKSRPHQRSRDLVTHSNSSDETTDGSDEDLDVPIRTSRKEVSSNRADALDFDSPSRPSLPRTMSDIEQSQPAIVREDRDEKWPTGTGPGNIMSSPASQRSQVKSIIGGTPQRARIQNIISPQEQRRVAVPLVVRGQTDEDPVLDVERARREKAVLKRKEAEQLAQNSPIKKRTRRF